MDKRGKMERWGKEGREAVKGEETFEMMEKCQA